jgi:hypothetical protein
MHLTIYLISSPGLLTGAAMHRLAVIWDYIRAKAVTKRIFGWRVN